VTARWRSIDMTLISTTLPSHGTLRKSGAPILGRTTGTRYLFPFSVPACYPETSISRITP
jgi:hypothetical protein